MRILFICNQGKHRSRTAAELYAEQFDTVYRGIYENKVAKEDMETADLIVVMEPHQREVLAEVFPQEYLQKHILCFDIPDIYSYKQPELVSLLKEKMKEITATIA